MRLPQKIEKRIDEYRQARKEELGKWITRQTAVNELLEKALNDIEPKMPIGERLAQIEERLDRLEIIRPQIENRREPKEILCASPKTND